jgi:hypothetical protein
MKTINETFTDKEHAFLLSVKGKDRNWHDTIILAFQALDEKEETKK